MTGCTVYKEWARTGNIWAWRAADIFCSRSRPLAPGLKLNGPTPTKVHYLGNKLRDKHTRTWTLSQQGKHIGSHTTGTLVYCGQNEGMKKCLEYHENWTLYSNDFVILFKFYYFFILIFYVSDVVPIKASCTVTEKWRNFCTALEYVFHVQRNLVESAILECVLHWLQSPISIISPISININCWENDK
jgi:hypothetical protein